MIKRKLVIAGDDTCGKRSLLYVFCKGKFPEVYVPTVLENCVVDVEVDGARIELELYAMTGRDSYDPLRPLTYLDSHVILVCFAIDSPDSLNAVQKRWIPEVRRFHVGISIILVGCKQDLRQDPERIKELSKTNQRLVTCEEGMAVARSIGACWYLECSAKSGEGIHDVLYYAGRAALVRPCRRPRRRKSGCIIL
ncbi:hypothetical protein OPQ81_011300 [Rhizoctonia solani]|nr:hypothetical protein OPQ81_011300 [Rhizoctonia solani]